MSNICGAYTRLSKNLNQHGSENEPAPRYGRLLYGLYYTLKCPTFVGCTPGCNYLKI